MCGFCTVWKCEAYVIMWVWIWWVLLWCGCFGNGKQHSLSTLTEVFPCFSSVVRQMPGLNSQSRGTDRISSELSICVVLVSVLCYCLLLLLCCTDIVLLCYYLCYLMYWSCVLYHCHRVLTQLQSTNISIYQPKWCEAAIFLIRREEECIVKDVAASLSCRS